MRHVPLYFIASVVLLVWASSATGATIYVPSDYATIQAAIDAAGDEDQIEVAPGTYEEAIDFLGKAIRLYSSGGPDVTTIDGTGHYHVVQCVSGEGPDTILEGFTITGGNANGLSPHDRGGGMYNSNSSPTVTNCTFSSNSAFLCGGGMHNDNSSSTVTNCRFSGNSVAADGGGMHNDDSSPTVTNCTFSTNSAVSGGGTYNDNESSPTVTNCTFAYNDAYIGGGMANEQSSSPKVTSCTFSANRSTWGGGMSNRKESQSVVTNCTFTNNSADWDGGGMWNYGNASPTVTNCMFSGNSAGWSGGGMTNDTCHGFAVIDCTFSGNSAEVSGGGMYNNWCWLHDVVNCQFYRNRADNNGGGMYNCNSSPTVTNCTFSTNSAVSGGGMYNDNSSPTVTNSIVWGNSPDDVADPDAGSVITYSCVGGVWPGAGNIHADPLFVGVGNLCLQAGSPCIDAGNNSAVPPGVTTDLAGNPRIVDGTGDGQAIVDIGAYEYEPVAEPCPFEKLEDLIAAVVASDLPHGTKNSLSATLSAALRSLERGNTTPAVNQLEAFINQVKAQRGKAIPATFADALIAAAEEIIAML